MFRLPKLVFSLVYLGQASQNTHRFYFQVHYLDPRFMGQRWVGSTGWSIRATGAQEVVLESKVILLWDPADSEEINRLPVFGQVYTSASLPDPRIALQGAVDALRDFVANCPYIQDEPQIPRNLSSEVRDSLLDASPNDEQDDEGPAPVFFDEFDPPRISLA